MKTISKFLFGLFVTGMLLAPVSLNAKEAKGSFSVKSSKNYSVAKVTRKQFDIGSGITFKKKIPISGKGKYNCEAGFKFAPQNNSVSKAEINEFAKNPARIAQIKGIIGSIFKISETRTISLQGYNGIEMTVQPRIGPGAAQAKGMMVMVETPQGRMTQICITTADQYKSAVGSFRAVTKAISMPE